MIWKHKMMRDYERACFLRVEVHCTGSRGGDASHGGHAMVRLVSDGGAVLGVVVQQVEEWDEWRGENENDDDPVHAEAVEVWAVGDSEMLNLADALADAGAYLRAVLSSRGEA